MDKHTKAQVSVIESYKRVFAGEDGEKVLLDLAKSTGFAASSFDPNNPDPHLTCYNEGARSIFLRIIQTIGTDTAKLIKLLEQEELNKEGEF